jgi:hypothetical protein
MGFAQGDAAKGPKGFGCSVIPHTSAADRAGQVVPVGERRDLRGVVLAAMVRVKPDPA